MEEEKSIFGIEIFCKGNILFEAEDIDLHSREGCINFLGGENVHLLGEAEGVIHTTNPVFPEELYLLTQVTDVYFAKEKIVPVTSGSYTYTFKGYNSTKNDTQKSGIAGIILRNIQEELKQKGLIAQQEVIAKALTQQAYGNNEKNSGNPTSVTFATFKPQKELERIKSAPLDERVYLVIKTTNLKGDVLKIKIKEKDGIFTGQENSLLEVLKLTEEEFQADSKEVQGQAVTEFEEVVSEQDEVIIPIRLRPKEEDDYKSWSEKIYRGKPAGDVNYTFNSDNLIQSKKRVQEIAHIIYRNITEGKNGTSTIASGRFVAQEDIENALQNHPKAVTSFNGALMIDFKAGDALSIPTYERVPQLLYVDIDVDLKSDEKVLFEAEKYPKSFLREENLYFQLLPQKLVIFPLRVKPENDKGNKWDSRDWTASPGANMTTYHSNRSGGRKHAGRDLYTKPLETVVAIAKGTVLSVSPFYSATDQITVLHQLADGRNFVIRYGELDPGSIKLKEGDPVEQDQELGKTGKLLKNGGPLMTINGEAVFMLHFEYFTGASGLDVKTAPLTNRNNMPFQRRKDLQDALPLLQEGYEATFNQKTVRNEDGRKDPALLFTSQDGIDFIKAWETFKGKVYNDSEGYATIGYGYLLGKKKHENMTQTDISKTKITWAEFQNGISKERAEELFKEDLARFESAVKRDIKVKLHQHEFDALVSLLYNTGSAFLNTGGAGKGETKIKKHINNGLYEQGAEEFKDVTNKGVAGLVKRRNAEIKMFKENIYDASH